MQAHDEHLAAPQETNNRAIRSRLSTSDSRNPIAVFSFCFVFLFAFGFVLFCGTKVCFVKIKYLFSFSCFISYLPNNI